MSLRSSAFKGGGVLGMSEGIVYGCSFFRNAILARILTKEDFGIAASLALVITLLEFSSKLGISRFVVRDKEGDKPEFISAAHLVQAVVGLGSSILIALLAYPLALLFGKPDIAGGMAILGVIPLLNGFAHLDVRRFERNLHFGASSKTEFIPQILITLLAYPIAAYFLDYRAVLVLLILKSAMASTLTHKFAKYPYAWLHHKEYVARMFKFGWPLLVNGFLMFGVLHGDQFIVASFYSMSDLAPYAAAASLTMAPTFFFGRIFNGIMLPMMAKVQDDPLAFARRYRQSIGVISAFSSAYSSIVILGASAWMQLVFGEKYVNSGLLLAWLAAANSFRNIRIAPALAALAKADSKNQMISNLWRVSALIPALILASLQHPVWMIAAMGVIGEIAATLVSLLRLTRRDGVPLWDSLYPSLLVALSATTATVGFLMLNSFGFSILAQAGFAILVGTITGPIVLAMIKETRTESIKHFQTVLSALPFAKSKPNSR